MLRLSLPAFVLGLVLASQAAAQSPFWLDGNGRVFTVDSFGRIAIDGRSTNWYPDRQQIDLQVTRDGDAVYTDSYGKLCRNGSNLYYDWIRPHYFKLDRDGNIYTVKDWVSQTIQRNGASTGFEIEKGSGFAVDDHGRLYYTSERSGNLCIDGYDTGRRFDRDDFKVGPDGRFYYMQFYPNHGYRFWLMRYDARFDRYERLAFLATPTSFAFDARGNLWLAEVDGRITKNGFDTGWRGTDLQLDGAGNCYTQDLGGWICRNGINTGWIARGPMQVAPNGDVVYLPDAFSRQLYKNGRPLGIWLQ